LECLSLNLSIFADLLLVQNGAVSVVATTANF